MKQPPTYYRICSFQKKTAQSRQNLKAYRKQDKKIAEYLHSKGLRFSLLLVPFYSCNDRIMTLFYSVKINKRSLTWKKRLFIAIFAWWSIGDSN